MQNGQMYINCSQCQCNLWPMLYNALPFQIMTTIGILLRVIALEYPVSQTHTGLPLSHSSNLARLFHMSQHQQVICTASHIIIKEVLKVCQPGLSDRPVRHPSSVSSGYQCPPPSSRYVTALVPRQLRLTDTDETPDYSHFRSRSDIQASNAVNPCLLPYVTVGVKHRNQVESNYSICGNW